MAKRNFHYGQTKAQAQADWLARFSDAVATARPDLAGRIYWDTAKHMMFSGCDATLAAERYIEIYSAPQA